MRRLLAKGSVFADASPVGVELQQGNGAPIGLSQPEIEALVDIALKKGLLDPQWLKGLAEDHMSQEFGEHC